MSVSLGSVAVAGRYELAEVVGRGRSPVYRARDTRLGRDVAVKRVTLAPDPAGAGPRAEAPDDPRARVLREARAAARVASPHAVAVYDLVEQGDCDGDAVWLVMELVAAPSLERLVHDEGPLDHRRAAAVGLGVLDALAVAHAQGVVHRDVKPANVLVGPTVKLADFGVAALRDESGLTVPGAVVGSPSYMAPEQAVAGDVGPAADLWALGALLYFAVEGVPPFSAGSALATASAVVHGRPRPPQRPGPLTALIAGLLAKDPRHRGDAASVRAVLAPLAAGRPAPHELATTALPTDVRAVRPGAATLTRSLSVRSGGRVRRRRSRRLALAAAVAAVAAGAAAVMQIAGPDGPSPAAPADARPAPTPVPGAAPAPAPAAVTAAAPGRHRAGAAATTTATTVAGGGDRSSPAPPPAKTKHGKGTGAAKATAATTTVTETTTTAPAPDPSVTEPSTVDPSPTDSAPTTTVAAG